MIIWRHLSDDRHQYVYHATRKEAERELERLSIVNCGTVHSRTFYVHRRNLERVEVWTPNSKQAVAKLMNKLETGEKIEWLK